MTIYSLFQLIQSNPEGQSLDTEQEVKKEQWVENAIGLDHCYFQTHSDEPKGKDSLKAAYGFRLNIDNLDYMINVRNMSIDNQNTLKHYVQVISSFHNLLTSCHNVH